MKEKSIARAYARSLMELGAEKGVDIADELTQLTEMVNASNDLENLLFLEVFTIEEKQSVLREILERMKASPLLKSFFSFLCQEKRLGLFPLIFKEVIVIDDHNKGFLKGVIIGAEEEIDPEVKKRLTRYMEKRLDKKVQLDYRQSSHVTAGHRLNVEDLQLDATIEHQWEQFRHTSLTHKT